MKRRAVAVLLACAAAAGCGKKGALLPPFSRTPQRPEAVAVFQRGATLFVKWRNPVKSIDGGPLVPVSEAEVWVLEEEKAKILSETMNAQDFEARARLAVSLDKDGLAAIRKEKEKGNDKTEFVYPYSIAGKKPASLRFRFAVRVKDGRSRLSEFTEPVSFDPQAGPGPPQDLVARVLEDRIELVWKAPPANIDGSIPALVFGYNVYRMAKDGPETLVNPSPLRDPAFEDRDFAYGVPIRYFVRASTTETPPSLESDDSEVRELVPEDVFPPAAPAGVVPVAGSGFVSLSWEANHEKDLAGYKVRRRLEGETEDVLLTPAILLENAFTDPGIEKGKRYRYILSSVDIRGNESARTEVVVDTPGRGSE